jgi:hypothetical protein
MVEILGKSLVSMKSLMNVRWEHHDECLLPAVFLMKSNICYRLENQKEVCLCVFPANYVWLQESTVTRLLHVNPVYLFWAVDCWRYQLPDERMWPPHEHVAGRHPRKKVENQWIPSMSEKTSHAENIKKKNQD